ncbi:MAG: DUF302 domain-containing protein [Anaerolineales bacterium]|nr:DUF302 domain-containing protein [Anaerolineales bacterium]
MLLETNTNLGIFVQLHTDYETALERVTAALKTEGFGVLTEIDVKATLKKKIDVDFRPYKILGACNPPLAYRALQAAPEVGLLLPCNVTVSQEEEHCLVSLIDPIGMMDFVKNPALTPIAEEARVRLERVAAALAQEN